MLAREPLRLANAFEEGLVKRVMSCTVVMLLLGHTTAALAQLPDFLDGGFETPAVGSGSFQPGFGGSAWGGAAYMNFNGISDNHTWITQYNPVAPEGTQVAFLGQAYGVVQSISLPVGTYYISLKAASGPDYTGTLGNPAGIQVIMDGTTVLLNTMFPQGNYTFNTLNTTTFTIATPGSHVFFFRSSGSATLLLDAIKLITNNALPTSSITSPASNQTFAEPASVVLSASATDSDGFVQSVQFYNGLTPIGPVLTSPPYTWTWTSIPPGQYTITAKAIDNRGGVTISVPVPISIVAEGYDLLPNITLSGGDGKPWTTNPPANVTQLASNVNNAAYAINQIRDLSSYGAVGQHLRFQVTLNGAVDTNNVFGSTNNTNVTDHMIVALNHYVKLDSNGAAVANQLIGVVFGGACSTTEAPGGIGIEWKALNDDKVLSPCLHFTGIAPRSLIFDFTALANSCAELNVYKVTSEFVGNITSCGSANPSPPGPFVSEFAGIGVAAINGAGGNPRYDVIIQPISQSLIYP